MERILCLIIGYVFGLIQAGYIYGKLHGVDIRDYGSKNAGSTNALRVMGKKAGAIVLFFDVIKCIAACTLTRLLFAGSGDEVLLLVIYTGLGVVLGHNYPFYMKFKGGKGIAATGGLIIAVFDLRVFLICLAVFLAAVFLTRYVSLGSILGTLTFFVVWVIFVYREWLPLGESYRIESCILLLLIVVSALWKHKENIVRLMHGTENKLGASRRN